MTGLNGGMGGQERAPRAESLDKRISDLRARIRATHQRNPGWDTSSLEQELHVLEASRNDTLH